jgi:uncharacterized membrane protein
LFSICPAPRHFPCDDRRQRAEYAPNINISYDVIGVDMRKVGALLTAGATFSGVIVGLAGPASASDSNRPVNVCNYSNRKVSVARVLDMPGGMVSKGWTNYENGVCKVLDARFLRMQSYGGGSTIWTFDTYESEFCAKNEVYVIYSPSSPSACTIAGGFMTSFSSVPAGSGTYTFNLRP